jgi:hypothetical protein
MYDDSAMAGGANTPASPTVALNLSTRKASIEISAVRVPSLRMVSVVPISSRTSRSPLITSCVSPAFVIAGGRRIGS